VLVDTDALIWHLRGYRQASLRLDQLSELTLSVVSYLELIQGMRNKAELAAVRKMLALRKTDVLPLTPAITQRAVGLMETLALSHGLQVTDALIAATALEHRLALLSGNIKHFASIDGLQVEHFEA
jgi:predicted nucleic acid-binding protein